MSIYVSNLQGKEKLIILNLVHKFVRVKNSKNLLKHLWNENEDNVKNIFHR
jgi:hypothetical protein